MVVLRKGNEMRQGTTPTHNFTIPFGVSSIKEVMVLYAQDDTVIVRKNTEDCTMVGNVVSVKLSQEDTFKFDHKKNVQIQIRVLTTTDDALLSDIKVVDVQKCLDDGVLV